MKVLQLPAMLKILIHQYWFCTGGSHATFTAEDTLKHIQDIDIVVRGEGELTTHRIADQVLNGTTDLSNIPGISYRKNSTIVHNPDVERIQNLDVLPFPYRDPEAISRYNLLLDFLNVPRSINNKFSRMSGELLFLFGKRYVRNKVNISVSCKCS